MKIKRSVLERIIREELASHIRSLTEANDEETDVVDAEKQSKTDKKKVGNEKQDKADKNAQKKKEPEADKLPVGDEPEADADLEKDVAEPDAEEEDAEEVTGGKIADAVTGKTIQSITLEPKSKTLPGATELVITFKEIPDTLKVLLTKTGQVKFHFASALHNVL